MIIINNDNFQQLRLRFPLLLHKNTTENLDCPEWQRHIIVQSPLASAAGYL